MTNSARKYRDRLLSAALSLADARAQGRDETVAFLAVIDQIIDEIVAATMMPARNNKQKGISP